MVRSSSWTVAPRRKGVRELSVSLPTGWAVSGVGHRTSLATWNGAITSGLVHIRVLSCSWGRSAKILRSLSRSTAVEPAGDTIWIAERGAGNAVCGISRYPLLPPRGTFPAGREAPPDFPCVVVALSIQGAFPFRHFSARRRSLHLHDSSALPIIECG
jgi:hypothetical protein